MTQPRFDLYTLVHKGQRRVLFEITSAAGQLSAHDGAGRQELTDRIRAFFATMVEHADHEDRYLLPLVVQAAPELAARMQAGHVALDTQLADVLANVDAALAAQTRPADLELYHALAQLTSTYLAHVALEDLEVQPALWAAFDDGKLAQVQGQLVAAHRPATVMFNLQAMMPAASSEERVAFLAGLRRNMPPPAFAHVRAIVQPLLAVTEWALIDAA